MLGFQISLGVHMGPTGGTQELGMIWGGALTYRGRVKVLDIFHSFIYGKSFPLKMVGKKFLLKINFNKFI